MKQNLIFSAFFIFALSTSAFAQNEDNWESKTWEVGEFTGVNLDGGFKVYLVQGDHCAITVKSTDAATFKSIKINRFGNDVSVNLDRSVFEYSRVTLYITFKTLEKLNIEGGVNLKTNGYLDLNDFKVNIAGGANIELNMKAKSVELVGEGGFLFELKGVAESFHVKISGAGHVSASELRADNVTFGVQGFGTGSVHAVNTLNARIEGVGMIRYKGKPSVTQYIDGLGNVKPLE